jgi:hypothetical protein
MSLKNNLLLNASMEDEIGGLTFLLANLNDYVPYIIIYVVGTLVGIMGIKLKYFYRSQDGF